MRLLNRLSAWLLIGLATLAASGGSHAQSGKLVLYTSQPDKRRRPDRGGVPQARIRASRSTIFRSGTTEVMGKLAAEFAAGAPKADVLLIADAVSWRR